MTTPPRAMPEWAASHHVERRAEPLGESAPLVPAWAERYCRPDDAHGWSCRRYHANWQQSRLDGRDIGLSNDGATLASLIRGLARRGDLRRILVCGSADYALLALVADAIDTRPLPAITVLDICETPLVLNRWYAEREGLSIETVHGDALDFRPAQRFDLILAHTLLAFFDEDGRRRLAERWFEALAPGGRVLLSHPISRPARPADEPRGQKRFADDNLAEALQIDAPRMRFKPSQSEGLEGLLAAAGFEIEASIAARRPSKVPGGLAGLWRRLTGGAAARQKHDGRDHAVILARRPSARA